MQDVLIQHIQMTHKYTNIIKELKIIAVGQLALSVKYLAVPRESCL